MNTIKLKRFALFGGMEYEMVGGWNDLESTHDSLEEAIAAAQKEFNERWHWWHIVDLVTQVKVKSYAS